jgi:AcrR family transcriptional regulator
MDTPERILQAAIELVDRGGVSALTTRAVCREATVTPPTLYHHFGDMDGLRKAVARRAVEEFLKAKRSVQASRDPVADLKRGWNAWIGFALAHPNQFRLIFEAAKADPEASKLGYNLLKSIVERLASDGRLRADAETAARTVWAASNGVLTLFVAGEPADRIRVISSLMLESLVGRLVD